MKYFGRMLSIGNSADWTLINECLENLGVDYEVNDLHSSERQVGRAWRIPEQELYKLPWDGHDINNKLSPDEAYDLYGRRDATPMMPTCIDPGNENGFSMYPMRENPYSGMLNVDHVTGWYSPGKS